MAVRHLSAIENKDQEALCRSSHVLKGLGGSFGFFEITAFSAEIEFTGKDANFEEAEKHFAELQSFCDNIKMNDG